MKRSLPLTLALGCLLLTGSDIFAQNPVLTGTCTGKQLTVTGNTTASKIEWIRNGSTIEQTNWPELGNPVIVAGKEGIWGGDNDHLAIPKKIFVTPAGDVYIADYGNSRVQKWSPPYTTGTTIASGLNWVEDVQVESGGTVLVSEHWGQRISRWPGNITVASITGGAEGMCVDAAGRLYLAEYVGHRVYRFPANPSPPANGTIVAGTTNAGNALNELNYPIDVQVDANGQIYVLDGDNDRIIRFPSNSTKGTSGTVVASGLGMSYPHSFSIDAYGTIFVTTQTGIYMIEAGQTPRRVSDLSGLGIHVLSNNQVFVADNHCVKRLTLLPPSNVFVPVTPGTYTARIYYKDGTVRISNGVNVQLTPAAPVATGSTLVCPGNTLTLQATSPVAGATYQWTGPLGYNVSGANPSIGAVTMAHSGNYIVTLRDPSGCVSEPDTVAITVAQPVPSVVITANTVRYFCPGIPVAFTATPVNGGPAPAYQWKKNGATVGTGNTYTTTTLSNGDVFACVMTSNAPCASPATVTSNVITMSSSAAPVLTAPAACVGATISVNSPLPLRQMAWYRNSAYVEDAPNKLNGIVIAGGNGTGSQTNQLNGPRAITKDASGYLYVVDNTNYRVLKFPPNSTSAINGVVVAGGNGQGTALNQLYDPQGLWIDAGGNLWVADGHGQRVLRFPPGSTSATNGTIVAGTGSYGSALNELYRPCDLQVDAAGYLYVLDWGNRRVLKFPPGSTAGTMGVVVAGGNGQGGGLNQLDYNYSMHVDAAGNVYVGDGTSILGGRVVKWAPGATSGILVVGSNGFGPGLNAFSAINDIYVDAAGTIYICDWSGHRVLKWIPGASSATIVAGGRGSGNSMEQLSYAWCVYVDADEYVYVSDGSNNRVLKIMPEVITDYTPAVAGTWKAVATSMGGCPATTNDVVINANNTPTVNISTPATTICAGSPVTFTATAANAGTAPVYQWKLNGTDVATGDTYTPFAPLANGDQISCELTVDADAGCVTSNTIMSNTITMTVNATMQITIAADNPGPVCPGASPSFTATATGLATPAYQWQVNGINAGGNSASFSPATLANGDVITCILTGTTGCPASNAVTSNAIVPIVYTTNDTILYVNKNVSGGSQSGLGWNNAISELSDALLIAQACNSIKEIWIAGGVYHPQYDVSGNVPADPRSATFGIPTDLRIYGGLHTGYSAGSAADVNNIHAGNYGIAAPDSSYLDGALPAGNVYHVVSLNNTTAGTLLNGLVVLNGMANGAGADGYGGGILVNGGRATIGWCSISNNRAIMGGGVYHANTAAVQYEHCFFYDNIAMDNGGGAYTTNGTGVSYVNSVFSNNAATLNGGALYLQAASGFITNCTFYTNAATNGAAIYHTTGNTTLRNSIVMGTGTAIVNGPGFTVLYSGLPALTAANEVLWFVSVSRGHPAYLRLTNCAPAVNGGNNASYGANAATAKDLAGNVRLQQGIIDQGAYESAGGLITISRQPVAAVVCTPVDTSFSVQASSTWPLTYQWQVNKNDGNGFTDTGGAVNPVLQISQPGTTQNGWRYRVYIKHCPYAADTSVAVSLTVNGLPAIQSITGSQSLCAGKTVLLSNTTIAPGIVWKSLNTSVAAINGSGQVQAISAGNTTIRFIATTAAGCADSTVVNITVNALPVMRPITGVQLLCANSSMQLSNGTTGAAGYWKSTNPTVALVNAVTGRVTGVSGGTTTIRYIATNAAGCEDSVEAIITVDNLPPLQPIVSATNDFKLCEQATLVLSNSTNAMNSYWKVLNNAVATINGVGQVRGVAAGNTVARFVAVGINNTGCTDSSDIAITVLPKLPTAINIGVSDNEICHGEAVTFTANITNGGASPGYQWMVNNQPAGSSTNTWKSNGLKDGDVVSCVLQSQAACASPAILASGIITMMVHPLPVAQPFADRAAIFKGDQLWLNAGITGAVSQIKWWPGSGLSNDTIVAPQARPSITTTYQVEATTQYGCSATGQVVVTVMEKQDIPNAFSPNGDGINDRWEIKYLDKFPGASVQVFNRYGQLMYSATSHQPGNGWDGRLKGQVLPMGTYYYIIDLKNGHDKLSGSITILK